MFIVKYISRRCCKFSSNPCKNSIKYKNYPNISHSNSYIVFKEVQL